MAERFNTVGLFGKYGDPSVGDTLQRLNHYLQQRGCSILLDEATARVWRDHQLPTANHQQISSSCDVAIIVGGDGTLLHAARSLAGSALPLIGINLGRLGFLTDISPTEFERCLDAIFEGHYREDHRFLLHCTIERDGEIISETDAFNDVVVHKWEVARMIELETYVDDRFVNTTRADGLIVSTPTGSTAYALSGGGPLLEPELDALLLVPICPHTLSQRPLVIHGNSQVRIVVGGNSHDHAQVTCDGQINLSLVSGDLIRIAKHPDPVRLIHPVEHDYFQVLRTKLNWGS